MSNQLLPMETCRQLLEALRKRYMGFYAGNFGGSGVEPLVGLLASLVFHSQNLLT